MTVVALLARLRKLEAIAVHRPTRVIVINPGPGGKESAEREIGFERGERSPIRPETWED
jgi:hypothetical protein